MHKIDTVLTLISITLALIWYNMSKGNENNMSRFIESETVELKSKYTDGFAREVVAFLNTDGGNIYIGIEDNGTINGVDNPDAVLKNISDCITDQIDPKPQREISSEILFIENHIVIKVCVQRGLKPLYCLKKYGFSSKGCLVRIGTTCKEMTSEEIQFRYKAQFVNEDYMLKADAKSTPLKFDMMKILLTSRGMHINENAFETSFSLKRKDGFYNLLAELMADQNMIPLIFVKFSGKDKTTISQRSDYGGQSLLLGFQKLKDRLVAENICKTDTSIRPRKDEFLYDIDCVNEALVNMLVHNDWTITEPLVSFYADRVVFTSHGGLPHGLNREEFFLGISHPRNAVLMRIFLMLGIVEHTGHGVPMIAKKYGREAFDIHESYIDVTIPFNEKVLASVPTIGTDPGTNVSKEDLTQSEKMIILELVRNPKATYNQLSAETGISRRSVSRAITSLSEKKYIERVGNNKTGFWKIIR